MVISTRPSRAVGVLGVLLLVLTGCGFGPGDSSSGSGGDDNTIRVIWQPSGMTSYFYANARNLWDKYQIKLQPIKIATGQATIGALAGDSADAAFMGGPPTVTALGRHLPLKIVFTTNDAGLHEGPYMNPKAGVKKVEDLRGKTVGVAKGSSADAGMHLALNNAGVPVESIDIRYLDPSQMLSAYESGEIDGAWVWDTWGERLKAAGAQLVAAEQQFGVAQPNSWVMTDELLTKRPQLAARFLAALNEGAVGANQQPDIPANEYASATGITPEQAIDIMESEPTITIEDVLNPTHPLSFTNANGFAHQLAVTGKMLTQLGVLDSSPSQEEIQSRIDQTVVENAKQVKPG